MARIRTIKPEFCQSESTGRLSREGRLLFVLLWTFVDDSGRARASSRMLASLLYPYDDDAPSLIEGWLSELEREGCVRRYEVGGTKYLDIPNWLKHQRIDRPSESKFPSFDEGSRGFDEGSRALATDLGPRTLDLGGGPTRGAGAPGDGDLAFAGKVVRLNRADYANWKRAYSHLDLLAELSARDVWLASDGATDEDRKRWFVSTSSHFANRNRDAKARSSPQARAPEMKVAM